MKIIHFNLKYFTAWGCSICWFSALSFLILLHCCIHTTVGIALIFSQRCQRFRTIPTEITPSNIPACVKLKRITDVTYFVFSFLFVCFYWSKAYVLQRCQQFQTMLLKLLKLETEITPSNIPACVKLKRTIDVVSLFLFFITNDLQRCQHCVVRRLIQSQTRFSHFVFDSTYDTMPQTEFCVLIFVCLFLFVINLCFTKVSRWCCEPRLMTLCCKLNFVLASTWAASTFLVTPILINDSDSDCKRSQCKMVVIIDEDDDVGDDWVPHWVINCDGLVT